jgi:3-hydroxyacyl-[acyl-carrier-protein] dehydratase
MRFLYYDRIVRIEPGRRIVGVKAFALSEEFLRGHFPREPLVPAPILLEAMAQVLGWGILHAHRFHLSAVLSLAERFRMERCRLRPGFTATITGEIVTTTHRDSLGRAWVEADGERVATLDRIIYAHVGPAPQDELLRRFCYYSGLTPEQALAEGGLT